MQHDLKCWYLRYRK